jgi:hypothetical protein
VASPFFDWMMGPDGAQRPEPFWPGPQVTPDVPMPEDPRGPAPLPPGYQGEGAPPISVAPLPPPGDQGPGVPPFTVEPLPPAPDGSWTVTDPNGTRTVPAPDGPLPPASAPAPAAQPQLATEHAPSPPESMSASKPAPQAKAPRSGGGGRAKAAPMPDWLAGGQQMQEQGLLAEQRAREAGTQARADETKARVAADAAAQAEANADLQALFAKTDARADALAQEIAALSETKIEPNRVWHNMGAAGQLTFLAGAALAGLANPTGGAQMVMQTVQNIVSRDVDAQMADIQNRRAGLTMAQQQMKDDLARGLTLNEVRLKAIAVKSEQAYKVMEAELAKHGDAQAAARVQQAIGQGRMALGQMLEEFRLKQKQIDAQNYATSARLRSDREQRAHDSVWKGVGVIEHRRDVTAQMEAQRRAADVGIAKTMRETRVHLANTADGEPIYAPEPEVAKRLNKKAGQTMSVVEGLGELMELRAKHGYEVTSWSSEAKARGQALQRVIAERMSIMSEQGVINKADYDKDKDKFGTVNGIIDNSPRLEALIDQSKRDLYHDIRSSTGRVPHINWASAPPGFEPGATIAPPAAPRAPGLAQVMDENRAADVKAARERDLLEADPVQSWILSP